MVHLTWICACAAEGHRDPLPFPSHLASACLIGTETRNTSGTLPTARVLHTMCCQSQCLSYSLSVWRNFNWITKKQTIICKYPTKQLNLMFIYAHLCTLVKNCQQYPSIFKKLMLLRPCLHWQPFLDSWPRCVPSHQWSCWRPCPAATCSNMLPSIKPSWVIRYEHHLAIKPAAPSFLCPCSPPLPQHLGLPLPPSSPWWKPK